MAYTALPFCPAGQHAGATLYCKDQPIVVKLAAADAKVQIARKALESFVHNPANYPGLIGLGFACRMLAATEAATPSIRTRRTAHLRRLS